ncbi:MAG TPA: nuclear transport factor 2 family protein [Conexibacter sp.]|nr:nuclear transport factor 2 family protein [Conexibacter sp.]
MSTAPEPAAVADGAAANGHADDAAKAAFVERFDAGWRGGAPTFLDHFLPDLVDDEVVLSQPLLPPARGHDGFRAFFETLFGVMPDLRGDVRGWRPEHAGVTIELALHGTLDGLPVELVTHDRIVLRDGRILSRKAQMDLRPLLAAVARRPRAGLPLLTAPLTRALGGTDGDAGLDRALAGLALGRIALGAPSRLSPRGTARVFGAGGATSPELDYMTRVFGIRAVALGLGWLTSDGTARRRWQRLAFMCDVSDTVAGIGHLRRRDMPRGPALATTALTGGYMLVGAARVLRDLRS